MSAYPDPYLDAPELDPVHELGADDLAYEADVFAEDLMVERIKGAIASSLLSAAVADWPLVALLADGAPWPADAPDPADFLLGGEAA